MKGEDLCSLRSLTTCVNGHSAHVFFLDLFTVKLSLPCSPPIGLAYANRLVPVSGR